MAITIGIDRTKVDKKLKAAFDAVSDFSVPFELIKESWFKGNLSIFTGRTGPGKYADLTPAYKRLKQKQVGFIYPILRREGRLMEALTQPGSPDSISRVIGKKNLKLGVDESKAPYFRFLADGTKRMKARPYVLLGVEQVAPQALNQRVEIWKAMITDFVTQKMNEVSNG